MKDLLLQGDIVELDVVVPDGPEAGQDLGERGHDQVLAVSARTEMRYLRSASSFVRRSIDVAC